MMQIQRSKRKTSFPKSMMDKYGFYWGVPRRWGQERMYKNVWLRYITWMWDGVRQTWYNEMVGLSAKEIGIRLYKSIIMLLREHSIRTYGKRLKTSKNLFRRLWRVNRQFVPVKMWMSRCWRMRRSKPCVQAMIALKRKWIWKWILQDCGCWKRSISRCSIG